MGVRRAGRWALVCAGLLVLPACKSPAPRTSAPVSSAPVVTAESTVTATATPAPPTTLDLTELGLRLTLADGWARRALPTDLALLPSGPQPVVLEQSGSGEVPLLVLATVAETNLGEADPAKAPAALMAGLRKSLDANLTLADSAAPTLNGLTGAVALKATGAYPALGLKLATATFISGLDEDRKVYLLAGFAPNEAAQKAIDTMLASLAPLVTKAEAEPSPAKP